MRKAWWLIALALIATGCNSGTARPRLFHPGTAEQQQQRAQRFDPYPEDDIGPALDGGRPRDYMIPPAEPVRARWMDWNRPG